MSRQQICLYENFVSFNVNYGYLLNFYAFSLTTSLKIVYVALNSITNPEQLMVSESVKNKHNLAKVLRNIMMCCCNFSFHLYPALNFL